MMEALRRFLKEPHGVTSQKAPFFIVTAMKKSYMDLFPSSGGGLDMQYLTTQFVLHMKHALLS
jgi:hypothetical protein